MAEVAAAYAMPLLGVTVFLVLVQRLIVRRKGFVSLTGKGGERRPIALGAWRWALFGYAMLVGAMSVFLPYIFLLQAAFSKAWGFPVPRAPGLDVVSMIDAAHEGAFGSMVALQCGQIVRVPIDDAVRKLKHAEVAPLPPPQELAADTCHEKFWNVSSAWACGIVKLVLPVVNVRIGVPEQSPLENTSSSYWVA